jgi:hypothetical protein
MHNFVKKRICCTGTCSEILIKGESQFEAMVLLKLKAKLHGEMQ